MTVEVPPVESVEVQEPITTKVVDTPLNKEDETLTTAVVEKKEEDPVAELLAGTSTAEEGEVVPTSATTEDKPKRKGLFNNPFANKVKKDSEEAVTTLADQAETTAANTENKITKGFGTFLSKVKQSASSNNIKELNTDAAAAPTTTTVLVEEENAPAEESREVHEPETPTDQTNSKRQSILSKLFGGGANKKKEEESPATATTEGTDATAEQTTTTEGEEASSPPLTRRVTGFFAKKMPKLDKKQKSTDKVETNEPATVETNNADTTLPAVTTVPETVSTQEHHEPTLVVNEAAEDATGVKVTETNPVLAATTTNTA